MSKEMLISDLNKYKHVGSDWIFDAVRWRKKGCGKNKWHFDLTLLSLLCNLAKFCVQFSQLSFCTNFAQVFYFISCVQSGVILYAIYRYVLFAQI